MDSVHAGGLGGTYGGNPVACAAALGAIETMAAEDLAGRARRIGEVMLPRLHKLAETYPVIADVRGRGAMLAIEMTMPGTLDPDPATTSAVAKACHQAGLVTLTCGTFGGSPVACAAALGAIETMGKEDLPAAARRIGDIMLPRLRKLAGAHPEIGDVRGRGAMIAIELVRPGTLEPDAASTAKVAKACHAAGLVVLTCGTFGNVLRFLPPLVISEALLDEGLSILEEAFAGL